jgi:hypothetical protein
MDIRLAIHFYALTPRRKRMYPLLYPQKLIGLLRVPLLLLKTKANAVRAGLLVQRVPLRVRGFLRRVS